MAIKVNNNNQDIGKEIIDSLANLGFEIVIEPDDEIISDDNSKEKEKQ